MKSLRIVANYEPIREVLDTVYVETYFPTPAAFKTLT